VADLIYRAGGFDINQIKDPKARKLILATVAAINRGVDAHLPTDVPDTLRYALEENTFVFSGFKTFHAMREIGLSLVNDKGEIKPYTEFQEDVLKLNNRYNRNYLYAEYKHAVGTSQMAAKWAAMEQDGDRYLLQYRTAEDNRVREDHAAMNGITLPPSDPFWDKYYPPNGWGCRCTAVQVRRGKYAESDPAHAMRLGDNSTEAAKQQMFRFNPGKQMKLFPPKHPYYKAPTAAKKVIQAEVEQLTKGQKRKRRIAEIIAELPATLTNDQRRAIAENCLRLEKKLGVTKGKPMSVDKADKLSANPHVLKNRGYRINCSATSAAFVLRERGFDIEAGKCTKGSQIDDFYRGRSLWYTLWKNTDGTPAKPVTVLEWMQEKGEKRITPQMYRKFYEENTKQPGTYIVSLLWREGGGHFTVLKRFADGTLRRIEPQWDNSKDSKYSYMDLDELCKEGAVKKIHKSRGVMRVDDKLFNENYSSMFVQKNK
jgi:SPP1 gp7 family putative phage head morphogenesis protein